MKKFMRYYIFSIRDFNKDYQDNDPSAEINKKYLITEMDADKKLTDREREELKKMFIF